MSLLKLRDAATGESSMDIVEVPEGLSLQIGLVDGSFPNAANASAHLYEETGSTYISLLLDRQGEDELFNFLASRRSKPMEFHY